MYSLLEERNRWLLGTTSKPLSIYQEEYLALSRKKKMWKYQHKQLVKIFTKTFVTGIHHYGEEKIIFYTAYYRYVLRHKKTDRFWIEERCEKRKRKIKNGIVEDRLWIPKETKKNNVLDFTNSSKTIDYNYNRVLAVQYAERWWNDYNPAYLKFDVDCTNYISQCLFAGGAPMTGFFDRRKGWWYKDHQYSYSWAVAHSLRWYLAGAMTGLRAKEVQSPRALQYGDVICYDFNGDGRFDHTTIVTGKDDNGYPLVNAHTVNSRMRYYSYEDSSAWTEKINYKFFHILDGS